MARSPTGRRGGKSRAPATRRLARGRPSSLTEATIKLLEAKIRLGVSYADAAFAAGIDRTTFLRWRDRGQTDVQAARQTEFSDFYRRVELANLDLKVSLIERVIAGSKRDPRLALKVLERGSPTSGGSGSRTPCPR